MKEHQGDFFEQPGDKYRNAQAFFDFGGRLYKLYSSQTYLTDFQIREAGVNLEDLLNGITRDSNPHDVLMTIRNVFTIFSQEPPTRSDVRTLLRDMAETFALHADALATKLGQDEETDGVISELFLYAAKYLTHKTSTTIALNHKPIEAPRRACLDDLVTALDKKFPSLEKGLYKDPSMYGNFFIFYFANTYTLNHKRYVEALAAFEKFLAASPERNYHLTRLLKEDAPDVQLAAETLLSRKLEKSFGVDPSTTLNAWYSSGYARGASGELDSSVRTKLHPYNTFRSLKTMDTLECTHPGSVKYLFNEYGIRHFGRYPAELLIAQFEKREGHTAPQLVVVFPYDDQNGAFYENVDELLKFFYEAQFLGATVRVVEASSGRDIIRRFNAVHRKHGVCHGAIIGGHGTPFSMRFGPSDERFSVVNYIDIRHKPNGVLGLAKEKFFTPNAPIALISCSTGQKGGFAQELSKYGLKVIAPNEDTALRGIRVARKGDRLLLSARYERPDMRMVYKDGKGRRRKDKSDERT